MALVFYWLAHTLGWWLIMGYAMSTIRKATFPREDATKLTKQERIEWYIETVVHSIYMAIGVWLVQWH